MASDWQKSGGGTRGFFGIGVEGISKPGNLGNMIRSAHAFGASFVFTLQAHEKALTAYSDTSQASGHLPLYHWSGVADMALPQGCRLVGVEWLDEAADLPSFHHPLQAAYIFGPERGALSPQVMARCDNVVRIPTSFCINVATAAAILMYDRVRSLGRFAPRPVGEGSKSEPLPEHVRGAVKRRKKEN